MANQLFKTCDWCSGSGKDREDHLNQCGTCCGEGSLLFCSCCARYGVCDHQIGSIPGVCRSCRGEVQSMVKLAGVSASEALAMLRASFAEENRALSISEAA